MSAPKTINSWGFMGKVETAYGTPVSPAGATDGILLAERPTLDLRNYLNDGQRGKTPGGAMRPRVKQSGRWGSIKAAAELIGPGAAYSATVKSTLDLLLRVCGMQATGSFTVGQEKYSYLPETAPAGLESATFQAYLAGQMFQVYGTYGTFEIQADGPQVPLWTFDLAGICDNPTDAAIPAITYPAATLLPAKAESIALTLGLWTGAVVRSFHFVQNREHSANRANINSSAGILGMTPGGRNPTLDVVVERCPLATVSPWSTASTYNPYELANRGDLHIVSLAVGATQYQRFKLWAGSSTTAAAAQAQLVNVQDTEDGPTATWTLTYEFKPSTFTADDEFIIITD